MFIAKKYLALLFVSCISLLFVACSPQSQVNPLIGTWRYTVLGAPDYGKLSFTADGKVYSFLPNDPNHSVIEGKYSFSEKEISIDYDVKITLTKISATPEIPDPSKVSQLENRAVQVMQADAKQFIFTINRSQQAFYLEKDKFSAKLEDLANGVPSETENYKYAIESKGQEAIATATAKKPEIKSYAGMVSLFRKGNEQNPVGIVCENEQAGTPPIIPVRLEKEMVCGQGSVLVK